MAEITRAKNIEEGQELLRAKFRELLYSGTALHWLFISTPGSGKTTTAIQELPEWMNWQLLQGLPAKVVISVPEYSLAGQIQDDCLKFCPGRIVVIVHGRDWKVNDEPVCKRSAEAKAVIARGGNPNEWWPCRECGCIRKEEIEAAKTADIIIVVHDYLFFPLSPEAAEGVGLWIVDESFIARGIIKSTKRENRTIAVEGLADRIKNAPVLDPWQRPHGFNTERANCITRKLEQAARVAWEEELSLVRLVNSPQRKALPAALTPKHFAAAGLTLTLAQEMVQLTRARLRLWCKCETEEQYTAMLEETESNVTVRLYLHLWETICATLEDTKQGVVQVFQKGDGLLLEALSKRPIREDVAKVPMAILDATGSLRSVQHFLPDAELALHVEIAAPHQRVIKVAQKLKGSALKYNPGGESAWSLKYLDPGKAEDDEERERRIRRLREIEEFCLAKNAALVTHPRLFKWFPRLEELNKRLENQGSKRRVLLGYGKMRGSNAMQYERHIVLLGRPMPSNRDILTDARARTGIPIPTTLAFPSWVNGKLRYLGSPEMDDVLQDTVLADMLQAIARGRGIRRTEHNPVTIWLFCGDVELPMATETVGWEDIRPKEIAKMSIEGLISRNPKLASAVLGVEEGEALEKRLKRDGLKGGGDMLAQDKVVFWLPSPSGPGFARWYLVTFRMTGTRAKTQYALVREDRLERFEVAHSPKWVERVLGEALGWMRKELAKW